MENQTQFRQLEVDAEIELPMARVQLVRVDHLGPEDNAFRREGVYWIDLCLTPRRPDAKAGYVDRWGPHRLAEMGSIIALPPRENMLLKSGGGRHASVICQLRARAVEKWLPPDFEWTDRRLEACLHIASDRIRWLLLRLNQELRSPRLAVREMCTAILDQVSIELARYIVSVNEPTGKGGLAPWRLRVIDERFAEAGEPPRLSELAELCRMSVRQLTRGFRTSRGCSISDYLAQLRIDIAKRKLSSSRASVKTIAASMGYASQSSFAFAFRCATGSTPTEYRKRAGRARALAERNSNLPRALRIGSPFRGDPAVAPQHHAGGSTQDQCAR